MTAGSHDEQYMRRCLELAANAKGWTFPNPLVGAVLVKNGRVIGEGYHKRFGGPHAEIEALKNCKTNPRGATLYVNLEPCFHYGKTPPCVDAVMATKPKRVVCAMPDPHRVVAGRSIRALRRAGIIVDVGILRDNAQTLNEAFVTYHTLQRPFIAIKFASSLDGKIATAKGDSKWITNESARAYARSLRSHYQSILVGINTVLKDGPHLGAREKDSKDPIRVILDSRLRIPMNAKVLRDTNVLIATTSNANHRKKQQLERKGYPIISFAGNRVPMKQFIGELYKRHILSIFVEGGSAVLGSFLDTGIIDKVYAFQSPMVIGGNTSLTAIGGNGVTTINNALRLTRVERKILGDNIVTIGYAHH